MTTKSEYYNVRLNKITFKLNGDETFHAMYLEAVDDGGRVVESLDVGTSEGNVIYKFIKDVYEDPN